MPRHNCKTLCFRYWKYLPLSCR